MRLDNSEQSLEKKKAELSDVIVSTLRTHPILSYFQSYHDVAQVLLLVLGKEQAMVAVPRMSLLRLRDYMLPTIAPARRHFELVSAIVKAADPELANHIAQAHNIFALSATHSLFAHDIYDYETIVRLYDFLLAHEPIMSIYLFAAVTISRRSELLDLPTDESDMLTFVISKLPQTFDLDARVQDAMDLFRDHPPPLLPGFVWWRLSQYSVLKTSQNIGEAQRLEVAERLCQKQIQQLRSQEYMQKRFLLAYKYKRPAASFTAMLMVGALAIWAEKKRQRQNDVDNHIDCVFLRLQIAVNLVVRDRQYSASPNAYTAKIHVSTFKERSHIWWAAGCVAVNSTTKGLAA